MVMMLSRKDRRFYAVVLGFLVGLCFWYFGLWWGLGVVGFLVLFGSDWRNWFLVGVVVALLAGLVFDFRVGGVGFDDVVDGVDGVVVSRIEELDDGGGRFMLFDGVNKYVVYSDGVEVEYGDEVRVLGSVRPVKDFYVDGRLVRYADRMRYLGVCCVVRADEVAVEDGGSWLGFVFGVRKNFLEVIDRVFGGRDSGLVGGVVLGYKDGIRDELYSDFVDAGLSHIVVFSGYNVAIFMYVLGLLALMVFGRVGVVPLVALTWVFIAVAGFDITGVRAGIMLSLMYLMKYFYGRYDVLKISLAAVLLMLMVNPSLMFVNVSFQLSVAAVMGILLGVPVVEDWSGGKGGIMKEMLVSTLAVFLFTLPVVVIAFGRVPILGVLSNLMVLLFVPIIMLFGVVGILLGVLGVSWAGVVSWPAIVASDYVVWVAQKVSSIGGAVVEVEGVFAWVLVGVSSVFVVFCLWRYFVVEYNRYSIDYFAKPYR